MGNEVSLHGNVSAERENEQQEMVVANKEEQGALMGVPSESGANGIHQVGQPSSFDHDGTDIEEGEIHVLTQTSGSHNSSRAASATRKRIQKWKKMARVRPHQEGAQLESCTLGGKSSLIAGYYDESMVDVDNRGKQKGRNAPMEVDDSPSDKVEYVAGPTQWALGFQ